MTMSGLCNLRFPTRPNFMVFLALSMYMHSEKVNCMPHSYEFCVHPHPPVTIRQPYKKITVKVHLDFQNSAMLMMIIVCRNLLPKAPVTCQLKIKKVNFPKNVLYSFIFCCLFPRRATIFYFGWNHFCILLGIDFCGISFHDYFIICLELAFFAFIQTQIQSIYYTEV